MKRAHFAFVVLSLLGFFLVFGCLESINGGRDVGVNGSFKGNLSAPSFFAIKTQGS